jgi:hypothetical protein
MHNVNVLYFFLTNKIGLENSLQACFMNPRERFSVMLFLKLGLPLTIFRMSQKPFFWSKKFLNLLSNSDVILFWLAVGLSNCPHSILMRQSLMLMVFIIFDIHSVTRTNAYSESDANLNVTF